MAKKREGWLCEEIRTQSAHLFENGYRETRNAIDGDYTGVIWFEYVDGTTTRRYTRDTAPKWMVEMLAAAWAAPDRAGDGQTVRVKLSGLSAYSDGFDAYDNGLDEDDCPFGYGTNKDAWIDGWRHARDDYPDDYPDEPSGNLSHVQVR